MTLQPTIDALLVRGKGILAADMGVESLGKQLAALGVETTLAKRAECRRMLFEAVGIEKYISGTIHFTEALTEQDSSGGMVLENLTRRGIANGLKVDGGYTPAPEYLTKGLEDIDAQLALARQHGCTFLKWRAVFGENPSRASVLENARRLAIYAKKSQQQGLVPIVEPEVLVDETHDIRAVAELTTAVQQHVFEALAAEKVVLEHIILKPNMVWGRGASVDQVAEETLTVLTKTVPASVPGIVFLSGGQGDEQATEHLRLIVQAQTGRQPWRLTFSYGRALIRAAQQAWVRDGVAAGQAALLARCKVCAEGVGG